MRIWTKAIKYELDIFVASLWTDSHKHTGTIYFYLVFHEFINQYTSVIVGM